jgi:Protein of unknown function (DUF3916)
MAQGTDMPRQLNFHKKQKVRGLRRRLREVYAMPESVFLDPFSQGCERGYIDYKLPINCGLVEGIKSRHSIKKLCIIMLLKTCIALQRSKPVTCQFVRVVASIAWPRMFSSRVTVFSNEEYFSNFFDRRGPYQTWSILSSDRNILQEWQLSEDFQISGIGYSEHEIDDDDYLYDGEVWFFGDIGELKAEHSGAVNGPF